VIRLQKETKTKEGRRRITPVAIDAAVPDAPGGPSLGAPLPRQAAAPQPWAVAPWPATAPPPPTSAVPTCALAFRRYCFTSKIYCGSQLSSIAPPPQLAMPTLLQYYCTTIAQ